MNGKGIEKPDVLLAGAAGKAVNKEYRLGILQIEGYECAAIIRFNCHADG